MLVVHPYAGGIDAANQSSTDLVCWSRLWQNFVFLFWIQRWSQKFIKNWTWIQSNFLF